MFQFIMTAIGLPLGYIMYWFYQLTSSYWLTIFLFTLVFKLIMFPMSLVVQKKSVQMVKIQPLVNQVRLKYAGDKEKIVEEEMRIYKENKYSPAMGCLPTLLQIPIILGLINVIYNPLKHLLHLDADISNLLIAKASEISGITDLGSSAQLKVVELVKDPLFFPAFEELSNLNSSLNNVLEQIRNLDIEFLGLNLASTPSLTNITALIWIPIAAGITTIIMCEIQNRQNVLQQEQSAWNKYGVTVMMTVVVVAFTFVVPAGVGLYWCFSNILSTVQVPLLNVIYNPKKYIDYDAKEIIDAQIKKQKELEEEHKNMLKQHRHREKEDYKRFFEIENKNIVFYSEKSGFYKYFKNLIEALLKMSDLTIHYVTNDPEDIVFTFNEPRLQAYYIGDKRIIPFMMKIESDIVVMTTPDIDNFHIKRSLVDKDIEYIYTDHGITNNVAALRAHALDNYDTIFCVGPHQVAEYRETEKLYGLKRRNLLKSGFGLLEEITANYEKMDKAANPKPQILIAPSWQTDNLMDLCFEELINGMLGHGYYIIVRPHPEYIKRYRLRLDALIEKYSDIPKDELVFELDFASNETVYGSDLVITDWSSISQEFSYATKKPSLSINTPVKILNEDFDKYSIVPLEIIQRDQIGKSIDIDKLDKVHETIDYLLKHEDDYKEAITKIVDECIFNFGKSGSVGAEYIIERIEQRHGKN